MKKLLSLLMLLMTAIPAINAADYKLVTSNEDLEAGAKYIIVSPEKKTAMGAQSNLSKASYRVEVSVDCVDNIISLSDEQTAVAVVELGGSEGSWTLKDLTATKGYIVAATSRGTVNVSETATATYEKCSINISSDAAAIEYSGVTYYRLLYNKTTPRFGCYAASSSLDKPLLFKQLPKAAINKVEFSLASGMYYAKQYVTLSIPEGSNEVRYSTDISIDLMEDGSGYKVYTDGESITIDKSCTLRAIATDGTNFSEVASATYTMKTLEPSIDVEKASGLVTITPDAAYEASNVKIYYTTNGDTPVAGSATEYTEPFTVAKETEVKAIAVYGDFDASDVASYNYSDISKVIFDASVSSDFGGLTGSANDISKKVFEKNGISLAFTKGDGTTTPKYYNVSGGETDVRFYVDNVITISSNDYVINKVVFTTTTSEKFVSVGNITSGTVSINETEMTWSGINSKEASFINSNSSQVRITKIEVYYSEVGTASFDAPVISLESGTYNVVQNVTLTVPEGTTVRYTTDDAVDLKEGTGYLEYSNGTTISILKSCTLRAIATDGTNFSSVASATYTMKTLEPSIDVEKASGLVTITPDAAYASNVKIYYTTNGDTPVVGSATEYTEPFTVAEETEVKAIAVFGEFDASDVVNYIYSNNIAVEFTIAGGEFGSTGDTFGDITKSPIKLSFTTTGSSPAKNYTTALRFYKKGSLSISGDGSKSIKITKVEITYSSTSYNLTNTHISVNTGTYTDPDENNVAVWTIGAESATLTNSGSTGRTSYITGIKVYYKEITIDAPVISLGSGTYNEVQKVKLTMPEGATTVRYTTDDEVDLENGTGYTEYVAESEITIDKSCTLRAVATDGTDFSKVASATYTMKTVAPVITAADAVDGVFTNEDGFLNVTFTCPPYNNDDVIISYEVKDDMAESTTDLVKSGTTITVYGNATITATALYGSFDESDPVTATYKWNNPNSITFTKTGNIVIADQDDNKFIAEGSSMGNGENYTLTDDLGNEYSIYAIIGDNGTTNNTYPRRSGYFRLYAASGNAVFISNNTLNIKSVAITHNNTAIAVNGAVVNAVDGVSTWNSSIDECHEIKLATTGGTSKEYNNDITKISITFEKVAPFDKVANNTELLSMEAGKYYQVNVNLQGVKSHNGVLYARTVDTTVNPSKPGKDYFDSYEDSDYAQFAQHDWVAIDGLGSDYESKNITAGFVAQYDGTKLLPVNDVVPGSDETVTTNTFGVANVFYGNYENTDGFGYKPFFVKAKLNEVATFVAKAVTADEIQGSGECGVINGKGLKVEGSDLTDNIGKYVALDGVLVADTEANGGVKVIAFGVGTPTGVDSAIAEGTVAIYGTEGAVSVTGVTGTVELYDATGRLAKVAEAEGSAVIAMPAGYYIVRASGVAKAVIVK